MDLGVRMLPAGERRAATENGGRDLPLRELVIDRDGRNLTVWIGPAYPGGPEEELWEMDVVI